jgi:DNA modification methylase
MKINEIHLNPDNPRFIKDDKFEKLKKSIKEFPKMMELRPIIIDDSGKILGGNMRYRALIELGYQEIPKGWVVKASELTEEEKKRFIIADNIPYGEFDYEKLGNEWDEVKLEDWGMDLSEINVNFEPEIEEDDFDVDNAVEENKEPICKLGDIWQLGNHRIMCGDSTKKEDVEKLMNGKKADMVFTDPPYNVDYGVSKNPRHKIRTIQNDKQNPEQWEKFCKSIFNIFQQYNNGDIYMWGASSPEGMKMRLWLTEMGCHWSATIVWKKQQLVLTPANYQRMYEPCYYGWFKKSSYNGDRTQTEVWDIDRPLNSKLHPTMKPVELCSKGIKNSSKKGNLILDLFLGSGSTLIACEQLNRICYGMEIDPMYCDVVIRRWEEYTKQKAEKLNA